MDMVRSIVLVFCLIEYCLPLLSLRLLYLLGAGTLSGYNGIWPLEGIFYIHVVFTYLETYIEKPLFVFRLSSKIVFKLYLEDPGELVKSLVKSDFLPYPIPLPLFLKVDGI